MSDYSLDAVSASQALSRTAKPAPALDGAGSGLPLADDVAMFQQALRALPSPLGGVARVSNEPSLLGGLSDYMSGRRAMAANQLSGIMNTRDPASIIEVSKTMLDQSVEQDLLVKVIGKSVSAIDQLTKLN